MFGETKVFFAMFGEVPNLTNKNDCVIFFQFLVCFSDLSFGRWAKNCDDGEIAEVETVIKLGCLLMFVVKMSHA